MGIGSAIVGGAASLISGRKSSKAQKKASETQSAAADRAAQMQEQMFQQQQNYLAPYRRGGYSAQPLLEYLTTGIMPTMSDTDMEDLTRLQGLQSQGALDVNDRTRLDQLLGRQQAITAAKGGFQGLIENNPLYQYQRDIGEKNLNRILSARGRSNSTFGVNALADQDRALVASQSQDIYNRLQNLSNQGMGVAGQLGNNAVAAGQNIGALYQNSGNAIAQGQLGAGQQRASMYSNLGSLPMQLYGQYRLQNALNGGGFSSGGYNAMRQLGASAGLPI